MLAQTRAVRGTLYLLFTCSMRYFDRAGLFAEACQEFGFLSPEEEKNSILAFELLPLVLSLRSAANSGRISKSQEPPEYDH